VPTLYAFEYAAIRVVPSLEREEFINAGVIVLCDTCDFLGARVELSERRLLALAPDADIALVRTHLEAIARVCAGGDSAGPIGRMSLRERFRWLVAPRSTILQASAAHGGLCEEPRALLDRLHERLVREPAVPRRQS
jgi:hypothetical protein